MNKILAILILFCFPGVLLYSQKTIHLEAGQAYEYELGFLETTNPGFSGSSYFNFLNQPGGSISWNLSLPSQAGALLYIRFANGSGSSRPLTLRLNGKALVENLPFEAGSDWSDWKEKILPLTFSEGKNSLSLESQGPDGGPNIDGISLVSSSFPPNFPPLARNDNYRLVSALPFFFNPLDNDSDLDSDSLLITGHSLPVHGSLDNSGYALVYTPDKDFEGTDSFNYYISDGELRDTAMVKLELGTTDWSVAIIESTLSQYSPETFDGWHYATALFLEGVYRTWKRTGKTQYLDFMMEWADLYVNEHGEIQKSINRLDDMLPGIIMIHLYLQTGKEKFRLAAERVRTVFDTYPRTTDEGLWHMKKKQNELWLDGLYMSMPFLVRYGAVFDEAQYCYGEAIKQYKVYASHLLDDETGLLYHAYDEDGSEPWASPPENHSPEFWGRSIGWFVMGLIEVLEIIPPSYPGYTDLTHILEKVLTGLVNFQDPATGLWYQVVNKGEEAGNWLETSCSIMYAYAISRAVDKSFVNDSLNQYAIKAYSGILGKVSMDEKGKTFLKDICEGTGVGDYEHYIGRSRLINNNHGLGAFLIMNELLIHDNLYIDELNSIPESYGPSLSSPDPFPILVYPNPADNQLTLRLGDQTIPGGLIKIYSPEGRILLEIPVQSGGSGENTFHVPLDTLPGGLFIGIFMDPGGRTFSFRFIKGGLVKRR